MGEEGSMVLQSVTHDTFDVLLQTEQVVVVCFSAAWCRPCDALAPIMGELAQDYPAVTFAQVDVGQEKRLAQDFSIRTVPTFMIFREYIALCIASGVLPKSELVRLIDEARALDMDEVNQCIAKKML
jgi:thioredoxin-like negative regulator of GroEL